MYRRSVFALPLIGMAPLPSPVDWRHDVSELRLGMAGSAVAAVALRLGALLGVRVTACGFEADTDGLAQAFHAGQCEIALGSLYQGSEIMDRMGSRALRVAERAFVLRSLPVAMRADIAEALARV